MTLVVLILWGLIGEGDSLDAKPITLDCGASQCSLSIEDAKAVARMQETQIQLFRRMQAEIAALKKRQSCRGGDT